MPTAVQPPTTKSKYDPRLEEQLSVATRRIRLNDVFAGVLVLVAIALAYLVAMIALDRWADVPAWVRQAGLVGVVGVVGVVGYYSVVRPLRRAVNPLYAAKQVEETVPDAKNSIVNYVDLHDTPMPDSIREAVGAKAAKQLEAADLNEAVNSRALARAGVAVVVLVVVLAALFLVFRPSQFFSLLGRTLTPFSSGAIATRTEIVLTEPAGGDVTVTVGQSVYVAVTVNGRVPDVDGPDQLRVLLRHNPADPNAEEVPLEPAGGNREWRVKVPDHLVQNGFWYAVAGGDAITPEYRVQVRSRPMFTGYEARYEYPAYLRLKPEVVNVAQIEGYRGTAVTLTARANRELRSGRMVTASQKDQFIPGEVVGDAVRFRFTLTENDSYQLFFVAVNEERNADAPPIPITVRSDQPPAVTITAPAEEEVTLPTNGLLKVDGVVGDDFGIDTVTLRLRLADGGGRALQPKPYQNGKSFRRAADETYPTSLEYKDSVALAELKDEPGQPIPLSAGMLIEYWLEASDNCTAPKANVGKSKVRRVRVVTPPPEPMKQQAQQQQAGERKQTEARHQQQQNQKLDTERRDPPPQPRPDATEGQPEQAPEPKPGDAGQKPDGGNPGGDQPPSDPMRPDKPMTPPDTKPGTGGTAEPMPGDAGKPPEQPKTGTEPPMPERGPEPKTPGATPPSDKGTPPQAGNDANRDAVKQEAQRLEQELKDKQQPGAARGADDQRPEQGKPAGERKGEPGRDSTPPAESKDGGNAGQPGSAASKEPGKTPEPQRPTESKGTPPQNPDGSGPGDPQQKQQPLGGTAGTDKPATPEKQPENTGAAQSRGGNEKTEPQPKTGSSKPAGKPEPGETRPGDPANTPQDRPDPSPAAGKSEKPVPSGERKSAPGSPQPAPETKPTPDQGPMAGGKDSPAAGKPDSAKSGSPRKQPLDPKQVEEAVKNLGSPDPQKQQDARNKLDQAVGKQAREEAEQLSKDLNSTDPAKRDAAQKKLDDLKAEAERLSREDVKPDPNGKPDRDVERLFREAQKLNSSDPAERKKAEDELDKSVGKNAREELQKRMKDGGTGDPGKDAQTKQQIEEMAKKQPSGPEKGTTKPTEPPDTQRQQPGGGKEPKVDPKELEQAVKDLASGDPQKQQAARDKLDKMVGKDARQEAEHLSNDLNSKDPEKRAAAEKKVKDLNEQARKAAGQAPYREPTAEEKQQLADAAKNLTSPDPQKQQDARDKLDQMVGKDARQEAEQLSNDLNSKDLEKQAAAQKKLNDLQKQAAGQQPKKDLTPEEKKQLADIAKGLASKDPQKQKEAAEQFADSRLGKDLAEGLNRQAENLGKNMDDPKKSPLEKATDALAAAKNMTDLAKQMKDLKSGDPKKAEEALKNLKDIADRMKDGRPKQSDAPPGPPLGGPPDAVGRGPGGSPDTPGTPLKGSDEFGKLPSELQLEKFKKVKDNPDLLKQLGYTPEDYARFLRGFEDVVKEERTRRDRETKRDPTAPPGGPTVNVSETSKKVESRTDGSKGSPQATGPSYAPPGYADPQKKFAEKAGKVRRDEKK